MDENYVLIAGLPEAGKSSFLGALSYVLEHPHDNELRSVSKLDPYMSSLGDSWMEMKEVNRSHFEDHEELKCTISNKADVLSTLVLPDFRGESFERVMEMKENSNLAEWYKKTNSLLFLMREVNCDFLKEETPNEGDVDVNIPAVKIPQLTISRISKQARNIMLLKYLRNKMDLQKVAFGISAWDDIKGTKKTPKDYLKGKMPVFYNYIMRVWPNAPIYGISAQGATYKSDDAFIDEMQDKAINGKRAYIVDEEKNIVFDITLPIAKLLK